MDDDSIESDTESDDWVSVVRRKPGMLTRMRKRKEEQCRWGDHCAKASNCPNKHTEEEKRLFLKLPKILFKYFKTRPCNKMELHKTAEQKRMCAFAHDSEDSWCLNCKMYSHLTSDCKVKSKT